LQVYLVLVQIFVLLLMLAALMLVMAGAMVVLVEREDLHLALLLVEMVAVVARVVTTELVGKVVLATLEIHQEQMGLVEEVQEV
jgi:hypothetical protein